MPKGIKAKAGWLAYGLSPRWLAALMAQYDVKTEFDAASSRQASELAS